jgi:hypothetical protein
VWRAYKTDRREENLTSRHDGRICQNKERKSDKGENVAVYKERLMKCRHEQCTVMHLFQLG